MAKKKKKATETRPPTIAERISVIERLQDRGEPDFATETCTGVRMAIHGNMISFTNDGDYLSLYDAQNAVKAWAEQLGMEVV